MQNSIVPPGPDSTLDRHKRFNGFFVRLGVVFLLAGLLALALGWFLVALLLGTMGAAFVTPWGHFFGPRRMH